MTTLAALRASVARSLRDEGADTFSASAILDIINAGVVEVGRVAPQRFTEDITPLDETLDYILQIDTFGGIANANIEVRRVEIWDGSVLPQAFVGRIPPASSEYENSSQAGYDAWNGTLSIPALYAQNIDPTLHFIRVWGYAPYPLLVDDADVFGGTDEVAQGIVTYARVEALQRLLTERDLFTEWQTRPGATDVSPAALMSGLQQAESSWQRVARHIAVIREAP